MPALSAAVGSFAAYQPKRGAWDEMIGPEGVRQHWDFVLRSLDALPLGDLLQRKDELQRSLRESGVTYNVNDESQRRERAWSLDLVPVVYDSREWNRIERGLLQRAELLDLVLRDLYGPRDLIRRGLLPAETVLSHPGFLRACSGMTQAGAHRLFLLAVDLARLPGGAMVAVADRAQAPSGAGYALENRIALSRFLPSIYRDAQVHRLAGYFRTLRNSLAELAPGRDDPRVALLTPGPDSETYFEHAFLTNYLGITLVQGDDLTVRDGRVFLRTLDGLEQVDVILRRLDDVFCDPLELRPDSLLGAPGLLQAARLGNVTLANPAGAGVLDNPALFPYLPRICRALLGQDLYLPSVQTWWCGDEDSRQHVLANLETIIVKPTFPRPGKRAIFPAQISENARRQLCDRIRANPWGYVAQEIVPLSRVPHLSERGLESRPMILRSYALSRGEDYMAMPGGLTRVSSSPDSTLVSNQKGGISKDTWVLASERLRETTLLRSSATPVEINRASGSVASRVAENLYWLGRYAERAEMQARALRQCIREVDAGETRGLSEAQRPLARAVDALSGGLHLAQLDLEEAAQLDLALMQLIYEAGAGGSLRFNIENALQAGRSVQDRLSDDGWRFLNTLRDRLSLRPLQLGDALPALDSVLVALSAFAGVANESMSRGPAWRFLDIGRRVERALGSFAVLQAYFVWSDATDDEASIESLLLARDSLRTYRRRYHARFQIRGALDLLLFDESNPQSAAFQLQRIDEHVAALNESDGQRRRSLERRLALQAWNALQMQESDAALSDQQSLGELLLGLSDSMRSFSEALAARYFVHSAPLQQL
ncbi:MAG: circularly permuted type 2 ATP-grasp protein [Leptospirales bacterium]|nr:circularly permuted type 2 ATP-grasp protein [Leptospirales bacterium]